MAARQYVGVAAPGLVTPKNDEADGASVGQVGKLNNSEHGDYAVAVGRAVARAARLGITVVQKDLDRWLLQHAGGADIGIVSGAAALHSAVAGFEQAHNDVLALINRMKRRPA